MPYDASFDVIWLIIPTCYTPISLAEPVKRAGDFLPSND